jgi:hypothetical protein
MRLRITLKRGIRQQGDILSPCHPISTRLNHLANDDEECSRPVELAQIQNRLVRNEGTFFVFCPLNSRAKEWTDEHVQPDAPASGNGADEGSKASLPDILSPRR